MGIGDELPGTYPVKVEDPKVASAESPKEGTYGGCESTTAGTSGGQGTTAATNPGLAENMGVGAAARPPAWAVSDFGVLITAFLGPGATAELVLSMLENMDIRTVPIFNQIFEFMSDLDIRFLVSEHIETRDPGGVLDVDYIVSVFLTLRRTLGARLIRNRISRVNHPCIPTRVVPQAGGGRISYPYLLSTVMLANSAQGTQARERAYAPVERECPGATRSITVCKSEGSSNGSKHFHGPSTSRKRARPTPPPEGSQSSGGTNSAETQAFEVACLSKSKSATFSFCSNIAYDSVDVADFVVRSLRNRARSDVTLTRVSKLAKEFYDFTQAVSPPLPYAGEESLIAVTKWLDMLGKRGKTVPGLGRYALKVYGEALGIVFPTDHPAVRQATAVVGHKPKSAPCLETDFLLALDAGANNKESPSGHRLYCSIFTFLALTSLRFGDTRMVQDLWVSDTALCGSSINNKDKSGNLMQWATPLIGLKAKSKWYDPLVKYWTKIKPGEKKFAALFPHVTPEWKIEYKRPATHGVVQGRLDVLVEEFGFSKGLSYIPFAIGHPHVPDSYDFPGRNVNLSGIGLREAKCPIGTIKWFAPRN